MQVIPASEIPGKDSDLERFERCVAEMLEGAAV
jgi:hypothetical protein